MSDDDLIPVKIGDRVVGHGYRDEDGFFHIVVEADDAKEFLELDHQHTRLVINDDYAEIELDD